MNVRRSVSVLFGAVLLVAPGAVFAGPAHAAVTVTSELVNVDFMTATMSSSTITNGGSDKMSDLTVSGSPTGLGTVSGLTFANTTTANTNQYITGNLGNTSVMSEIVVEFVAKFTDAGCEAQAQGSMIFSLGSDGVYIPYNIYRHSNFIGFNTFNSDIYGITIPDTTGYHSYKFVMLPNSSPQNTQEIWVDGVQQSLVQNTTSVPTAPCSTIVGVAENSSGRVFTGGSSSYSDGSFMLMSHPLAANNWGTTGSLKNIRITTSNTYVGPDAPLIDDVIPGDGQLSVHFAPPSDDGGSAVADYEYSTDNGVTWVSAASTVSPIVITGLSNGTSYTVKLRAINSAGDGAPSSAVVSSPSDGSGGGDPPTPPTGLADTGVETQSTALASVVAIGVGLALLVASRRKRSI